MFLKVQQSMLFTTFALLFSMITVKGGDPTCSTGIKSSNNPICCPIYCQTCDQGDCASKPGGIFESVYNHNDNDIINEYVVTNPNCILL